MNKVKILCDTSCDLGQELYDKFDIATLPLHIGFPDDPTDYLDGVNIFAEDIYKRVDNGGSLPRTSATNAAQWAEYFKKYVDQGYDVVSIGIGSGLSSSYANSCIAAEEFPGRVFPVDGQNLSSATGLLALKMCDFRDQGMSAQEISEAIKPYVSKLSSKFTVDRLDYLYKGGRCSGMSAIFGNLLHIHPILKVYDNKINVAKKIRGPYLKCLDDQIEEFKRDLPNIDTSRVFITSAGRIDGLDEYIKKELVKYIPEENIFITTAACTVSSHCGPKTIGILYLFK